MSGDRETIIANADLEAIKYLDSVVRGEGKFTHKERIRAACAILLRQAKQVRSDDQVQG